MRQVRSILAIAAPVMLAACTGSKSTAETGLEKYATIVLPAPDLSGISENGKEVLNLYRFAAYEADNIYWKQYFGDKSLLDSLEDRHLREFAAINYGPWNRLDGTCFIDTYPERPAGVGFYPSDMEDGEFTALADSAKYSPYTIIERTEDGGLRTVWFHDRYAPEIERIASYLRAAADITIKPSVRNYLLKKIDALKTDSYYDSDIAWLEMEDSKMDLVIGPNETNDDQLKGIKRSYGALVLLKDAAWTARLGKYAAMIPTLQEELPCPDRYKQFRPGSNSDVFVCNALHYAGSYNAGIKEIAINLPYDEKVQAERGTRTILLGNIIEAKFDAIISQVAELMLTEDAPNVTRDAFFLNLAFREIAHGLGVKETVNGKGSVEQALGSHALTWEEAKANVVGTFLSSRLEGNFEKATATFIASLLRSQRFGPAEAIGRGNTMILNYLLENHAITRTGSGKYMIDYDKTSGCISELAGIILKVQAEGGITAAESFERQYGGEPKFRAQDELAMSLENIPIDVTFNFRK